MQEKWTKIDELKTHQLVFEISRFRKKKNFVGMKFSIWKIYEFKKLCKYTEQVLSNWTKSSYKIKVCVVSHFKTLDLRCKMTVMPLDWVLGA